MNKKSFVVLASLNGITIVGQVCSIWVIYNSVLGKLKQVYSGFGVDLNASTLFILSIFEKDWKLVYLMPMFCAGLLLVSFFIKKRLGLLTFTLLLAVGFLVFTWFALLEPMLRDCGSMCNEFGF